MLKYLKDEKTTNYLNDLDVNRPYLVNYSRDVCKALE